MVALCPFPLAAACAIPDLPAVEHDPSRQAEVDLYRSSLQTVRLAVGWLGGEAGAFG